MSLSSTARAFARVLLGLVALMSAARSSAEELANYPAKPIRIVVPASAGGTTDIVARVLAQTLGAQMNANR